MSKRQRLSPLLHLCTSRACISDHLQQNKK